MDGFGIAGTAGRWYRPTMVGLSIVLFALAAYQLISTATTTLGKGLIASDVSKGYLVGAQRFLDTGSPYTDQQIAGPWALDFHSFIHPPAALPLFVPFLALPLPLWWAIPVLATLLAIYRLRPAPWTWPLMAACLVWPRSTGALRAGNSDIWAMSAVAAGAVWGWPIVAIVIKPTFALLALVAVRRRSAWIAGVAVVAVMLPLLPLWLDWVRVVGNAGLGPAYSLLNLPLVLIGAIAYVGRTKRSFAAGPT